VGPATVESAPVGPCIGEYNDIPDWVLPAEAFTDTIDTELELCVIVIAGFGGRVVDIMVTI
jgi:hypothetical protein